MRYFSLDLGPRFYNWTARARFIYVRRGRIYYCVCLCVHACHRALIRLGLIAEGADRHTCPAHAIYRLLLKILPHISRMDSARSRNPYDIVHIWILMLRTRVRTDVRVNCTVHGPETIQYTATRGQSLGEKHSIEILTSFLIKKKKNNNKSDLYCFRE